MSHAMRLLAAALLATLLSTSALTLPAHAKTWAAPSVNPKADPSHNLDEFENRVLAQINKARARHGLRKVRVFQSCVDHMSERWARHIRRSGDFQHRNQITVLNRCDLHWTGETLVRGVGLTPRSAVRAWLHSPSHRAVILKKRARWAGVGARIDSEGRVVGVLNFGDPT